MLEKIKKHLILLLKLIAVITVISGLIQMIVPGFMLGFIGGETSPGANHSFGIVGMFMVLFGGLLLQALFAKTPQPIAVFWCGLQKFGATAAVTLGVVRGLFSWLALSVAAFDLFSAVLIFVYWWSIRKPAEAENTPASAEASG